MPPILSSRKCERDGDDETQAENSKRVARVPKGAERSNDSENKSQGQETCAQAGVWHQDEPGEEHADDRAKSIPRQRPADLIAKTAPPRAGDGNGQNRSEATRRQAERE